MFSLVPKILVSLNKTQNFEKKKKGNLLKIPPWITAQLNGPTQSKGVMFQPGFYIQTMYTQQGLSDIFLCNFSNRLKRRHEADTVKPIPPPPETLSYQSQQSGNTRITKGLQTHTV